MNSGQVNLVAFAPLWRELVSAMMAGLPHAQVGDFSVGRSGDTGFCLRVKQLPHPERLPDSRRKAW
jgi:hypothetical protein